MQKTQKNTISTITYLIYMYLSVYTWTGRGERDSRIYRERDLAELVLLTRWTDRRISRCRESRIQNPEFRIKGRN